jgi:hypothetical protein
MEAAVRLSKLLSMAGKAQGDAAAATPPDLASVRAAEMRTILGSEAGADAAEVETWGLALSGGGIRSATFGLGVLQALARLGLLRCFHYQSTVSGGGYVGAFLQGLIRRHGFAAAFATLAGGVRGGDPPVEGPGARPIRHLREYSNYLAPRKSPFSGDTLGLAGSYVRNVLLVQAQLCALILALCLLPLLLYAGADALTARNPGLPLLLAGAIGMAAVVLLAWVSTSANRRPAPGDDERPPPRPVVLAALATILALALASMLGALGLARFQRLPSLLGDALSWLPPPWTLAGADLGIVTAALYLLVWHAWLLFDPWYARRTAARDAPPLPLQRHPGRFVLGTVGAAIFAGVAVVVVRGWLAQWAQAPAGLWHVLVAGPLLVFAAVALTAIVHLGLAGPAMSDLQREVWARVGGKTLALVMLGMSLTLALTLYGPWLLRQGAGRGAQVLSALGWAGVLAWLSTTGVGLLAAHGARAGRDGSRRWRLLDLVARLAPWVFVLGLLVALSLAGHVLLQTAGPALERLAGGVPGAVVGTGGGGLGAYLRALDGALEAYPRALLLLVLAAALLWLLLAWAVDVNEFSLNAFYRNRLVRCYLGASNSRRNPEPTTNFDVQDDLVLADLVQVQRLDGARPLYPLIGAALNLVAAKQLDWQDRKAASFCLTPGWCGHLPPDARAGEPVIGDRAAAIAGTATGGGALADPLAGSVSLGSAIAISGAAVNPNMGYHSSPAVTFLLTLFDARLGWWLPNPSHPARPRADSAPFFGRWLLAELLGRTHAGGKFVHLSDGGHFENLGVYELVRRGCRFVLCVDAGADGDRSFGDLGNAVHKCRVDFGVEIDIDVSALVPRANGLSERSCAVGRIAYPDGRTGTLLYLKPTLSGEEPPDIAHYARSHPCFPHEPTSDQFFDEAQFESYRRLGQDIAVRALAPVLERIGAEPGMPRQAELGVRDSAAKEKLLIALRQHWVAPVPGVPDRFATHGRALGSLLRQLRNNPQLAVLDAQFHPAWSDLVQAIYDPDDPAPPSTLERHTRLPEPEDFRACFYFCQELIRLMEVVYHDLALEHAWDHPDNRGWLNAFRHWSWAPMFRIAWVVGAPMLGARFVAFCQQRLALPRLDNEAEDHRRVLRLERHAPAAGEDWRAMCDRLRARGAINHVEHSILLSDPLCAHAVRPGHVYLLRLKWAAVLGEAGGSADTTLGVAALAEDTLRLLRIQDHVRRLGLASEFMRLLINRQAISAVDIRGGYYGVGGVCRNRVAARLQRWLLDVLAQARRRQRARREAESAARAARRAGRPEPPGA